VLLKDWSVMDRLTEIRMPTLVLGPACGLKAHWRRSVGN
jgi:hypothetical protein